MVSDEAAGDGSSPPLDLGALYSAEFQRVVRVLRRVGVPPNEIEDVAQEAFLKALRFSSTFDRSKAARPWLLSIAYRAGVDHLRHPPRRDAVAPRTAVDPNPSLVATNLVAMGVRELQPALRSVLELHAVEGFTIVEIAEKLGLTVPTAYARYRAARLAFIAALGGDRYGSGADTRIPSRS